MAVEVAVDAAVPVADAIASVAGVADRIVDRAARASAAIADRGDPPARRARRSAPRVNGLRAASAAAANADLASVVRSAAPIGLRPRASR